MVWKERLCALQAPVAFGAVNGQFGASGLRRGNKPQTARWSSERAPLLIHYHFEGMEVNFNQWFCPG